MLLQSGQRPALTLALGIVCCSALPGLQQLLVLVAQEQLAVTLPASCSL